MSQTSGNTSGRAELLNRTMLILSGQIGLAWLGSLATWSLVPTQGALLVLASLFFVTAMGSTWWGLHAERGDPWPLLGAAVFAFITGAFMGPAISAMEADLGRCWWGISALRRWGCWPWRG